MSSTIDSGIDERSPVAPDTQRTSRIVNNAKLRRQQHINAAIATSLGLLGVVLAVAMAIFVRPIGSTQLLIFLCAFIPIQLGVTVGFHRLFTHRSFEAKPALRVALAILGSMAAQGPVTFWVALHRLHHECSDDEGDPHSPNLGGRSFAQRAKGVVYAYIGWTVRHEVPNANHYARDLLRDPLVTWVNRHYRMWVLLGLLVPALIAGALTRSWIGAAEGLVWGGLVRMFVGHNMIWWITSFAHVFGRRDFESGDFSTNNAWIAIPTLGEGWHNNHHAFPYAATLNFHWWQLDLSGLAIRSFGALGLARNIRRPAPQLLQSRRLRPGTQTSNQRQLPPQE